jgi:hypothetical protein
MSFENDKRIRLRCEFTLQRPQPKYKRSGRNDIWESDLRKARATIRKLDHRLGYWENNERPPFDYEFDSEDYDHPDYKGQWY